MLPSEGNFTLNSQTIYTPSPGKKGIIKNIRISNTAITAYSVQVTQISKDSPIGKPLIDFSFSAYRLINDNTEYEIPQGSSIQGKASLTTVTFVINGEEVDL